MKRFVAFALLQGGVAQTIPAHKIGEKLPNIAVHGGYFLEKFVTAIDYQPP
jgi:hypothetical protein